MIDRRPIAILNRSTVLKNADIAAYLPALQLAVDRDFCPAWGLPPADLEFLVDPTAKPQSDAWLLIVADDSDQAGALGYHDVSSGGMPIGYVFAKTDLEYNENWRITMSHELFEMLPDPMCNSMTSAMFRGKQVMTIREACDAVEGDDCAYDVNGFKVSDFVLPAFFDTYSSHPAGTKFDHCGHVTAPMTIAVGGYMSIMDPSAGTGWKMVFGDFVPMHKRLPPRGSRRERFLLRENHRRPWRQSTAV